MPTQIEEHVIDLPEYDETLEDYLNRLPDDAPRECALCGEWITGGCIEYETDRGKRYVHLSCAPKYDTLLKNPLIY